jgi:hypothetical protein
MKTIKDLTPKIKAKIPQYIENALKDVFDGKRYYDFDLDKAKQCVYWNYEKCGYKKPLVVVAENPLEAQYFFNFLRLILKDNIQLNNQLDSQLFSQLSNYNNSFLWTMNVYSDTYFAWYAFIMNELEVSLSEELKNVFETCFHLQKQSGIYSAIFSELVCVVSKYPKKVYRNENNDLHNSKGIAVEWGAMCDETKFNCYYINGRQMPN